MRYGVRLVISGYRVYYCVLIIADEPTRLQIAYRLRIIIVLMCAVGINVIQELLKCSSVTEVRSESQG